MGTDIVFMKSCVKSGPVLCFVISVMPLRSS